MPLEELNTLEPILEAQTLQNEEIKANGEETNALLQALIAQGESDNDSLLEAQIAQAEQHNKELKEALKESTFNFQLDGVEMASITGPQGEKGEKGDKGDDGAVSLEMPNGTIEKKEGKIVVKGLKGDKGDKGERGEKGENGKDGVDGKVIFGANGRNGKDGIDGKDGLDGVDGKDGSPDTPKQIKKKLESLKDDERLDVKAIKGIKDFQKQLDKVAGFASQGQEYRINGTKVANNSGVLNFVAGSGATITGVPTSDGATITIGASGGSGSIETVTGLNTDNTDPANPIVKISVDGVTVTGLGTPASPLVAVGDGTGDVHGPASSTDNAIARYDSTTGKIIQNSGATIDDNNNVYSNNNFTNLTSTVSDGGTTVLTIASSRVQRLTGSSSQTFQLPNATTLPLSSIFDFDNNSSSSLIITNAGGSTLYTIPAGGAVQSIVTANGTSNGSWDFHALTPSSVTWGSGVTGLVMNSVLTTSPSVGSGASSSTTPSFIPQRGASTTGFGGDGTNLYATIGGVARATISSTGITATNLSGTNTGDQTSVSGNAGTATALQTARTIGTLTGDVTSTGSSFDGTGNNTNSTTIANSAVTLAKMANLAQDQFIGRTTASTGVPETATITAAARTVLDDTTVAAMVDTLGGATSTGTGGIARATSPTFVTPALGTPSALVATNATGTATGLTSGITNALKSATTTVDVSAATAPTSGQVLTATSSTAATWQTPSGGGNPGWDFVSYNTTTASSITISSLNLNTDLCYKIIFECLSGGNGDESSYLEFNSATSAYAFNSAGSVFTSVYIPSTGGSASASKMNLSEITAQSISGEILITRTKESTNYRPVARWNIMGTRATPGETLAIQGSGYCTSETNLTSFKLSDDSSSEWKVWVFKAAVS